MQHPEVVGFCNLNVLKLRLKQIVRIFVIRSLRNIRIR